MERRRAVAALVAALAVVPAWSFAQENTGAGQTAQQARVQRGAQRPAGRAGLPPIGRGMDAQSLQAHLDAWAIVQAEQQLKLGTEQYPNFVARLTRLQNLKRRITMQRRQQFGQLRELLDSPTPKDEAIAERLKALDDFNRRVGEEVLKAYQDIDSVLTPWQRGRFRLFEEIVERRKVELLAKIGSPGPALP